METIEEFCPAKVNLFLAITGRRPDGFHELISLMAPLDFGDTLRLTVQPGKTLTLFCNDPSLPCDERNLVWQAVEAFRRLHPFSLGLRIDLEKRVPTGAGLGGGSSDAVGLLRGLNRLLGNPLAAQELHHLAASLGSDCPFFLRKEAAIARGRGELISRLPEKVRECLRGCSLILIKPSFSISTAWAYGAMAKASKSYCPAAEAEDRLTDWISGEGRVRDLLFNNMQPAVFGKYIPLPVLKKRLEREAGVPVLMSGSGSTLFVLVEERGQEKAVREVARNALGARAWLAQTQLN